MVLDRMDQFVQDVDSRVRRDGERGDKPERIRHKLDVVVAKCGWKRRSDARMRVLENRLSEMQLWCEPSISDANLPQDTWITMRRRPPPVPVQRMPSEATLEGYLERNWYLIKPLMDYGSHRDPAKVVVRQFRLPTGEAVDLVFKDRVNKRWLLVELKNAKTQGAVAQLRRYMQTVVNAGLTPNGYTVEGMIISPTVDPEQIHLLHAPNSPGKLHWFVFEMQLELRPAEGSTTALAESDAG